MCPQNTNMICPRHSNSCGGNFPDPNQRLHVRPEFLPHFGASWPSSSRVAEGHTGPCGWNGILWCHRWLMLTGLGWLGNWVPNFWRISADQCGVPCWATVAAQKCNRHSYSSSHNKLNGHNSDAIKQWWGLAMGGYVMFILFVHWFPLSACRIRCVILLLRRSYLCEKTRVCEGWSWWVSGSTDFVAEQRILPGRTLCVEWSGISRIENYIDLNQMSLHSTIIFQRPQPRWSERCHNRVLPGWSSRHRTRGCRWCRRYIKIYEDDVQHSIIQQHFLRFQSSLVITVGFPVDERASTFLRAAILHNWDRLCSWICQDTNVALLFYLLLYQHLSAISIDFGPQPQIAQHPGPLGLRYYSCSRQADVQEAVRAAQVRTTGNAFASWGWVSNVWPAGSRCKTQFFTHSSSSSCWDNLAPRLINPTLRIWHQWIGSFDADLPRID